ncbi:MAG: hypothetical protein HKM06_05430 [Spirochaetales bacterium]|nr:hypothetical protein [Spirochaetales bacterium]
MKKILLVLFTFCTLGLSAQTLTDLTNPVYHDLEAWANQGYIRILPMIKPYSGILLASLLKEVVQNGDAQAQEKARSYQKVFFQNLTYPDILLSQDSLAGPQGYYGLTSLDFQSRGMLGPNVYADGQYGILGIQTTASDPQLDPANVSAQIAPVFSPLRLDYKLDKTSLTVGKQQLGVTFNYATTVSVGNDAVSFQTGYSRTSIDSYEGDSIILSPQAFAAPQMTFTWRTPDTVYQSLFMALDARLLNGQGAGFPGKYLNFSSFQWRTPSPLEIDLDQTVVYGQRLDPGYFIPGIPFLQAEMYGNTDNLFLGAGLKYFFPNDIRADAQLYLDDFTIVKFLAGNFNTGFKAAANLNLEWTPSKPGLFKQLGIEYTLVTPYTYTHTPDYIDNPDGANLSNYINGIAGASAPVNYLDYTTNGAGLGTVIGPNSDRLRVNASLNGPWDSSITSELAMIRHGNASAGANTVYYDYLNYTQPGTVFDPGYDINNGGANNLYETLNFLNQTTIMTVFQASLGFKLPFVLGPRSTLTPYVKLEGEWYRNLNEVAGDNGFTPFVYFGGTWEF